MNFKYHANNFSQEQLKLNEHRTRNSSYGHCVCQLVLLAQRNAPLEAGCARNERTNELNRTIPNARPQPTAQVVDSVNQSLL